MIRKLKSFLTIKDISELGQKFFYLGIFFLPSALPISGLLFIISLIISFAREENFYSGDKLNFPINISLILIIFSTINTTLINVPKYQIYSEKSTILISLFNWIPIFLSYWGFQNYLNTLEKRIISAKFLVSGIFPLLVSCIMQNFFSMYGPYKTLFGLIVWFNKPISSIGGVTGLFSNPNYTAIFLTLTIPFIYFFLKNSRNKNLYTAILLIFLSLSVFFALATNSRYVLFALITTVVFLLIRNINKFFLFLSIGISGSYIFNKLMTNLLEFNINDISSLPTRLRIWIGTINLIKERPFWGWGGSTFSYMINEKNYLIPYKNIEISHSHNLIFEVAYNFGIPVALILSLIVLFIFFRVLIKIIFFNKNKNNFFNKVWLFSFTTLMVSHLVDVTYYDGKISLIFIILLSGLRCMKKEIIIPKS